MIQTVLITFITVTLVVLVQMTATRYLIRFLGTRYHDSEDLKGYWAEVVNLSIAMLILMLGHILPIGIWAAVFMGLKEFTSFSFAFYHSAVNFTSLGYGDHVMSETWRVLGPLEAASGVLMFGLSAAIFFAVLTKIFSRYTKSPEA